MKTCEVSGRVIIAKPMSRPDVLIIDLHPPHAECWACGEPTPSRWGLPIDTCAELVASDYEGEWGGVPACRECYEAHDQGLLATDTMRDYVRRRHMKIRALQHLIVRE